MGFPMTVERVIARNHIDPASTLADDVRRLADDAATLAQGATARPVGYWTVRGDITSEQAMLIRDQLPPDPYDEQMIVREGITLVWHPLRIDQAEADLAEALGRTQVQERLLIDLASAAEYHITVGGHDGMAALDYMVKRVRAFLAAHPVAK